MLSLSLSLLLVVGCAPRPEDRPTPPPVEAGRSVTVTVFAIRATPGAGIDPRLAPARAQLRSIAPDDRLDLIATASEPLKPGETLTCDLGDGRIAETTFEKDEDGRVLLRCVFKDGDAPPFATRVDAPENQLFFYERPLHDDARVLVGVGAR